MNVIKAIIILAVGFLIILSASGVFKLPVSIRNHAHRVRLLGIYNCQDSLVGYNWSKSAGYPNN